MCKNTHQVHIFADKGMEKKLSSKKKHHRLIFISCIMKKTHINIGSTATYFLTGSVAFKMPETEYPALLQKFTKKKQIIRRSFKIFYVYQNILDAIFPAIYSRQKCSYETLKKGDIHMSNHFDDHLLHKNYLLN